MDLNQHTEMKDLLELLKKSENDVRNGKAASIEDAFKDLKDMLISGD